MPDQLYQRDKNGIRLDLAGGINTMAPADAMEQGYPYLQNVRRNLLGRAVARPALGGNVLSSANAFPITSLVRMNDALNPLLSRPYALILGDTDGKVLVDNVLSGIHTLSVKAFGLSGKSLSFVTFRPNASPESWCYIADPSMAVNIVGYSSVENGMLKVRADGTTFKAGIKEPQIAPSVGVNAGTGPNWVIYRYTYRSSITGAVSNPSPESAPQTVAQTPVARTYNVVSDGGTPGLTYNNTQWQFSSPALETIHETPGQMIDYVVAKGFLPALAVPDNVVIDGVEATLNWAGQNAGTGVLTNVGLYYQGALIGQPKAVGAQNVKFSSIAPFGVDVKVGDNTDTWAATLTPAVVNDPSFGFGIQITEEASGDSSRSFLYTFKITVYYTVSTAGVSAIPSIDPQVDKVDFYRQSPGLLNFTYVGTVPNDHTVTPTQTLHDTLTDLAASANPLLEFDNFEPFPSIGLPHKGRVNVVANPDVPGGTKVVFASGDPFDPRWLPGNIIIIGGVNTPDPATAYSLYNRPFTYPSGPPPVNTLIAVNITTDPVTGYQVFSFPPAGNNLTYEIAEPTLAAQASPTIWGPTPDNYGAFYFGLDPNNPGDLLWSKGNNFDSASDTNRLFVTSPSEVLMNGTVTAELSTVFSAERFWLINWNFADAIATVTGTEGPTWTLTQAAATRGLYMRYAIAALGSMIAYRAKDCIAVSMGGGPEQSVTDSIYNLFPHGGSLPQPVVIGGQTVYPPDDTNPDAQTIALTPSYIFYNYQDTTGTPRTLVYDLNAKGWSVDVYTPTVDCHLWAVTGDGTPAQLLAGCSDGTVRLMGGGGEVGTAIIATRSENGGDARAFKRVGDVFLKALVNNGTSVTVALWQSRFTLAIDPATYAPTSLNGTGRLAPYVIDFLSGFADDVDDIAALLSWPLASTNVIDLWQPDWTELPETVQDRPSDWANGGTDQNKFIQGFLLECDTFGRLKTFQVESDDGLLHTPVEVPFSQSGEAVRSFTFNPPFTAHMVRIVSTDEVPWRFGPSGGWSLSWIAQPFPESSTVWTTEASSFGLLGYIHCYQVNLAYVASAPVTFAVKTDQGTFTLTFPAAGTPALPAKILLKCPRNKWKIAAISCTSPAPIQIFKEWSELWLKSWGSTGEYVKSLPFGGDASPAATI